MTSIETIQGDITKLQVDAIVNAANTSLLGGGGVDGAIHRAGGPAILADCLQIRGRQGGCATGEAVITTGGNLPARNVIHTVGPVWSDKQQEMKKELLHACYANSLWLAVENDIQSIAFPAISTGIYRFPKELAAEIAVEAVRSFPELDKLNRVIFVCFDAESTALYHKLLAS